MRSIYFDYNATTPLDPGVREVMLPFLGDTFGNPSSVHHRGRQARAALDDARERIASVLRAKPSEIVFTSGGTESNNLAIFGTAFQLRDKGRHIVSSAIEHHSVLHALRNLESRHGFEVTLVNPAPSGRVSEASIAEALRPDTILVSVMAANNETGVLQPVSEIGEICQARGVTFHTDAVQWFGKEPVTSVHDFHADLVSLCAHKMHGPKGAGLLFIRSPLLPDPILFGGGHENERRAGTENLAGAVGLAESVVRFTREPVFPRRHLSCLVQALSDAAATVEGVHEAAPAATKLANTLPLRVLGADSIALVAALDLEGVCVSSGSACSAGSLEPSHVLRAMLGPSLAPEAFVRFSLGRESTSTEVLAVAQILPAVIARIRAA